MSSPPKHPIPREQTLKELQASNRILLKYISGLAIQIRGSSIYEDRLEYEPEDLQRGYDLTPEAANILHAMLHNMN